MKIANIEGRAHLITAEGGVDIGVASVGKFPSDPMALIGQLDELRNWESAVELRSDPALNLRALQGALHKLAAPVPEPGQIFAIGLNYRAHTEETGAQVPSEPMVFTKFQSSIAGPGCAVRLPSETVDWEVELVAVIGKAGRNIARNEAHRHVAGYCVGQDYSDRKLQMISKPAQFSLAKSYEGFSPIGPWITTADEANVLNARISCRNEQQTLQDGDTGLMIFGVADLVAYISNICELRVGDLIFTGTPDGVGLGRKPPLYIENGWEIESAIEGLGSLKNSFYR